MNGLNLCFRKPVSNKLLYNFISKVIVSQEFPSGLSRPVAQPNVMLVAGDFHSSLCISNALN